MLLLALSSLISLRADTKVGLGYGMFNAYDFYSHLPTDPFFSRGIGRFINGSSIFDLINNTNININNIGKLECYNRPPKVSRYNKIASSYCLDNGCNISQLEYAKDWINGFSTTSFQQLPDGIMYRCNSNNPTCSWNGDVQLFNQQAQYTTGLTALPFVFVTMGIWLLVLEICILTLISENKRLSICEYLRMLLTILFFHLIWNLLVGIIMFLNVCFLLQKILTNFTSSLMMLPMRYMLKISS